MCDFTCWFQVVLSKMLGLKGHQLFHGASKVGWTDKISQDSLCFTWGYPLKTNSKMMLSLLGRPIFSGYVKLPGSKLCGFWCSLCCDTCPEVFWCVALGILQQLPFWWWQQLSVAHWNLHCLPWIRPLSWRAACSVGHGWYQHGSVKPS